MDSTKTSEASMSRAEKQYHTKRPHRKSRAGCRNCKARKVKCDEARPSCRACTLRKEKCKYPPPAGFRDHTAGGPLIVSKSQSSQPASDEMELQLLHEPLFTPADKDALDMKLLWVYTTHTFASFSATGGSIYVDDILRVRVVQHAFQTPFLMNTILGLSAMHLKHTNQPISPIRAIAYHARAFEGYRKAVEESRPETFPSLLVCSLFLCALSTDPFRAENPKPLYVLEWMKLWKGINLVISILQDKALWESGMIDLFFRPPIVLDEAAQHIPNNLLFMVTSIKEGDPDFEYKNVYYKSLRYLGSLYQELPNGFSPLLDLRILTFFTFLPKDFFPLAQSRRPRALVIVAYYLAFAKTITNLWWMEGISDREIHNICNLLGPEWAPLLQVPRMAAILTDNNAIGKLLLDNYTWEPPADADDTAAWPKLKWVDDQGIVVKPVGRPIGGSVYDLPTRVRKPVIETYKDMLESRMRSLGASPDSYKGESDPMDGDETP